MTVSWPPHQAAGTEQYLTRSDGVSLEGFKSLSSDWLDWMTGSEKYSNRVTYIKYKLPPLTPWVEAVMRNKHMALTTLTCVLLPTFKLARDRRTTSTPTQLVFVSMGEHTLHCTVHCLCSVTASVSYTRRNFQLT